MTSTRISLVIPAFNAAAYLPGNVARVLEFFDQEDLDGEVIVADDGSMDGTADTVVGIERVRTLRLAHGGKGAALRAGVAQAGGDVVAFTDADLPYGMQPLALAMAYIYERRYHAVIGDRTLPGSEFERLGAVRGLVSELASFAFRTLVTGGIYDTQCGFKVFRGDVARELFRLSRVDGFAIDVELIYLLLKYRLDLKRIPVQLERSAPSTVRVVRDSGAAMRDIAMVRLRWAVGHYRSSLLHEILERELREDVEGVAGRGRATKAPPRRRPQRASSGDDGGDRAVQGAQHRRRSRGRS